MLLILALGPVTLWQVFLTAPMILFFLGILVLGIHAILTYFAAKGKVWVYPANIVLALLVLYGTVSSPSHLPFITSAGYLLQKIIIVAGNGLELILVAVSILALRRST